jgi:hypothetical protein
VAAAVVDGSGGAAPAGGAVVVVAAVDAAGAVVVTPGVAVRVAAAAVDPVEAGAVAASTPMIPTMPARLTVADTTRLSAAGWRRPVRGRVLAVVRRVPVVRARRGKRGDAIPPRIGIRRPGP